MIAIDASTSTMLSCVGFALSEEDDKTLTAAVMTIPAATTRIRVDAPYASRSIDPVVPEQALRIGPHDVTRT
jgi:hypothetical protein